MGSGTWTPSMGQIGHISSLLMTDCCTLHCLAMFSRILPFFSIPMALHLPVSVKCCMAAFEDKNCISVGLWISRGLKEKSCEHCSNYVLRGWQLTAAVLVTETVNFVRWPLTISFWSWSHMTDNFFSFFLFSFFFFFWGGGGGNLLYERHKYDINRKHQFHSNHAGVMPFRITII